MSELDWNALLREQVEWHWLSQVRERLSGLTDEEYFWEPVPGCWTVRPRGTGTAPVQAGSGAMVVDFAFPEPDPVPFTTIAWRLAHVLVGVLAVRNADHFGGPTTDYDRYDYPGTAAEALRRLDTELAAWQAGVAALGADGLRRPSGPAEGSHADSPLAVLVLHINRELIHHLSEVCLLRDLYRHTHRHIHDDAHDDEKAGVAA